MPKVQVIITIENGLIRNRFAFWTEESALKKCRELAGREFKDEDAFISWQRYVMPSAPVEIYWYELEINQ